MLWWISFLCLFILQHLSKNLEAMLCRAPELCTGMIEIAYQRKWLHTTLSAIRFNQCLVQGLWSTSSPLLQLPHVTEEEVKHMVGAKTQRKSLANYLRLPDAEKKGLSKLSEEHKADVLRVCKLLPCIKVCIRPYV